MFKEIAIEPAAVAASYRDFSYVIEKFGLSEGRLIAVFPSKWKRYVYQAAQRKMNGTTDLSKLEVRLRGMSEDVFYARSRPGDGCTEDWIDAAFKEHERQPFDAIITELPAHLHGASVAVAELDGLHPCFALNRQWKIKREAASMAECCGPVLSTAKHLKLVDPHFDVGHLRYRRPFLEFLRLARQGVRLDIYRNDREDVEHIKRRLDVVLEAAGERGAAVRLFIRPKAEMHNRFVLSPKGGLYFMTGLDDDGGHGSDWDVVGVLDPKVQSAEWEKYSGDDPVATWP